MSRYGWIRTMAMTALVVIAGLAVCSTATAALGCSTAIVMGRSMRPNVDPGDLVVHCPTEADHLRVGDIVVASNPSLPTGHVTHRVSAVLGGDRVVLRGDANTNDDPTPIAAERVEGVARLVVPALGLPVYWFGSHQWVPFSGSLFVGIGLIMLALPVGAAPRTRHPHGQAAQAMLGR